MRTSGNALQYIATLFLLDSWPFALLMPAHRHPRRAGFGGLLWDCAMGHDARWLPLVAALRETSVLFAVQLGTGLLQEVFTLRRFLGTCVIVGGLWRYD